MGRRKRNWAEDDDSSSGNDSDASRDGPAFDENDPDAREEQELFSDPYKRKRRRPNGRHDALYGVFGEDDDGVDGGRGRAPTGKKPKYTKPVSFVSGKATPIDDATVDDEDEDKDDDDNAEDTSNDSNEEDQDDLPLEDDAPSPRAREDSADEPVHSGLGSSMASHFGAPVMSSSAAPSSSELYAAPDAPRRGLGARGGIGSSSSGGIGSAPTRTTPNDSQFPAAFGSPSATSSPFGSRAQRSFLRDGGASAATAAEAKLSAEEQRHFNKLSGSYGAKLMAKMGWQAGQGLGLTNPGIVTPIEVKLRPKTAGIAYKGFKERTEQSKVEARRRGEVVSDDEGPTRGKSKASKKIQEERSNAWKKPKKQKTQVKHMTYEEIMAETEEATPSPGLGVIIDATGATPREVSSLADVSTASWAPTAEAERLPEVRHNLAALLRAAKGELDGYAREAKAMEERKKWVRDEDARLRKVLAAEDQNISRLRQINSIVEEIGIKSKEVASSYEASLDSFADQFDRLSVDFSPEYDKYELDEVVVGAITPYVRRRLAQWNPLQDPTALTTEFRRWKKLLKMTVAKESSSALIDRRNMTNPSVKVATRSSDMTHYESLLWNVWLPRLRSSINNEWSAADPFPLIHVFEAWSDLIPPFMYDNIMDQLVMPKLLKAVSDWTRTNAVPLHTFVLPWLPHVGPRVDSLIDDSRRKMRTLLRSWTVVDGVPQDLIVWKDVLAKKDWEELLLKYVVPKLGASLREDFKINPRKQDMEPLFRIAPWVSVLKPSVFSQLLELEFFPKWLNVLHLWLVQPTSDYNEVAQWYQFWKASFSDTILQLPGVAEGFTRGLQLMYKATELSSEARATLPKPDVRFDATSKEAKNALAAAASKSTNQAPDEITFRAVVEDFVSHHNLLFVPMGKAHPISRMPLFRISQNIDGRGGVTVYMLDDVVWAVPLGGTEEEVFHPIGLEDVVLRATRSKK